MNRLKPYIKALAQVVVTACAYLIGVIPAAGGLGDVTVVQWLGLIVFIGAAFGITQSAQNTAPAAPAPAPYDNLED